MRTELKEFKVEAEKSAERMRMELKEFKDRERSRTPGVDRRELEKREVGRKEVSAEFAPNLKMAGNPKAPPLLGGRW